ncbi:MAG TPA: PP0621 family protein [Casimicrobiaceae bacterium]|jgi:uncharacterized protein|nr:PP0621 family protein [Casimicrobiaceae bacterium]
MGKLVFWLVLIFAALFVLRIANAAKARRRGNAQSPPAPGLPMVKCRDCGVFLPRADAVAAGDDFRCRDGCGKRR